MHADGNTIAVLGHGLAAMYPRSNARLADTIVEKNGLLLTEFPLQMRPDKYTFPSRNRIIAGLSLGTIVAEAADQSGSLITASLALEYGREVFAVPGQIFDKNYEGAHHLIIKGGARLITNAEDILTELGIVAPEAGKESTYHAQTPEEQTLLERLSSMPQSVNDLVEKSEISIALVNSTLTLMELKGGAKNVGMGMWVRL
jgi:DNA processing protein